MTPSPFLPQVRLKMAPIASKLPLTCHLVGHCRPCCRQVAPRCLRSGFKSAEMPFWNYIGSLRVASNRPRCRFGAILAASRSPTIFIFLKLLYVSADLAFCLQDRLRSPKMAQDGPKMAPRWLQDGPKTAPRRLQVASEAILELPYLYLSEENSRGSPKLPPRGLQEPPKRPPRGPKRPQEAP